MNNIFPYLILILSSVLSAAQAGVSKLYSKKYGNSMDGIYKFSTFTGFTYVLIMLIPKLIKGTFLSITPFSLIVAFGLAFFNAVGIIFMFSIFKYGAVSLYVLFSKLGTLLLPTLFAVIFLQEKLTIGKMLCIVCIIAALIITIDFSKSKSSKKVYIFYFGIFLSSGLVGVLISLHQKNQVFEKVSGNDLTTLLMLWYGIICLIVYILLSIKNKSFQKTENKPLFFSLSIGNGLLYGLSTILLAVALLYVPSSVQYPLSSGLAIVFGGIVGLFFKEKITVKFLISTVFVVLGTIALSL